MNITWSNRTELDSFEMLSSSRSPTSTRMIQREDTKLFHLVRNEDHRTVRGCGFLWKHLCYCWRPERYNCSHGKYEQYLPTYVVGFTLFIYNYLYLLNVHWVLFISDFNQRVVFVLLFTIIIQLEKYAEVCKPPIKIL